MNYQSILLHQDFIIERLVTVHYFEYTNDFHFPGERHDFWEFLCVDKGEVEVTADDRHYTLKKGMIIFHKPNEFHSLKSNGVTAPNLVVVSFECNSPYMDFFKDKVMTIGELERGLLASIIAESYSAFQSRLDDPYLEVLERRLPPRIGSEQMIRIQLEQMLIQLFRRYTKTHNTPTITKSLKLKNDAEIYQSILVYLENNIHSQLSITQICEDNLIGRSQLQKLFRKNSQHGVIDYFSRMKINTAKQMIREKQLNFTQISDSLGYTSIHYFSRQFKKIVGMTPSEYASSIKVFSDTPSTPFS